MTINRIRAFNRFYTGQIGLITNRFLDSKYSLVQARLLYELNHGPGVFASELTKKLGLSPDYLSKAIAKFQASGLVTRTPSPTDARKLKLSLTRAGKTAYAALKDQSNRFIGEMIRGLNDDEKSRLTAAMDTIEQILAPEQTDAGIVTIRSHRPGDMGMVVHRHGVLYAREYDFNDEFDAYVALGMGKFIENMCSREYLWIAEVQNKFAGSVAIVRRDDETAQLRWLIVEPEFRKKGIGRQLVKEAVRFSREKGYSSVILWTIDFLGPARHLYAEAGFRLTETQVSTVWGHTLTEECWNLALK